MRLEPGREIDELIAEKIMRFTRVVGTEDWRQHKIGEGTLQGRLPAYSTDIAAAWEVVEKLKDDSKAYGFELTQDQGEILEWIASFGGGKFVGESSTPSHAICLAALKAFDIPLANE